MSIKRKIRDLLSVMLTAEYNAAQDNMLVISELLEHLQEPPTVRKAPDLPEHGDLFWIEYDGVTWLGQSFGEQARVWSLLNNHNCFNPEFMLIEVADIEEWLPVEPPQFTEQGHD